MAVGTAPADCPFGRCVAISSAGSSWLSRAAGPSQTHLTSTSPAPHLLSNQRLGAAQHVLLKDGAQRALCLLALRPWGL